MVDVVEVEYTPHKISYNLRSAVVSIKINLTRYCIVAHLCLGEASDGILIAQMTDITKKHEFGDLLDMPTVYIDSMEKAKIIKNTPKRGIFYRLILKRSTSERLP